MYSVVETEDHIDLVTGVIHLPDGQRMVTCSRDGSLRVWNLKSGKQVGGDWWDGDSGVRTMALSPDGKRVVSVSWDGKVRLWNIDTGKVIARWMGHTETVWSVCWGRDIQRMVGGYYGIAREWDVENRETILICKPFPIGHERAYAVVYSPDMTMFATGGLDGARRPGLYESLIRIRDAKTDGKTLISGSGDSSIRIWNTTNWKEIAVLHGHTNGVYDIAISLNGRILASASTDKTARLWNLGNRQPISSPLHHTHFVNRVSFSADGELLATSCDDYNAYVWDVSAILTEAGLDDLLDQRDKSLLADDATRRSVRQLFMVSPRVLRGFFDDTPNHAHHCPQPRPSPSYISILCSRFLSLFRPVHPDAHDTPSRPRQFHRVRSRFSGKLHKRRVVVQGQVVCVLHDTDMRYPSQMSNPYMGAT
jgi:WD40 repeat protein